MRVLVGARPFRQGELWPGAGSAFMGRENVRRSGEEPGTTAMLPSSRLEIIIRQVGQQVGPGQAEQIQLILAHGLPVERCQFRELARDCFLS